MNQLPYMPLYWNDLLSDNKVRVMSNEELGAYVRLLGAAWHEDIPGTLPADDDDLARLAGAELSLWRKLSRRILPCFKLSEQSGRYEQKRMMAEHAKVAAQVEMKQSRASLGAEKRWEGHVKKSPANAKAMLKHPSSNANQSQKQNQKDQSLPDLRSAPVTAGFAEAYEAEFGAKYAHTGGKDGTALKKLLGRLNAEEYPPEKIVRVIRAAMARSKEPFAKACKEAATLHRFSNAFNEIRAELNADRGINGSNGNGNRPRAEPERDTTPLAVDPTLYRAFLSAHPEFRSFIAVPATEADMPKGMLEDWKDFKRTQPKHP